MKSKRRSRSIVRAANKFKPFDYGFLLKIEEKALIRMRDYFKESQIAVGNERRAELIAIAINVLRIATEKESSLIINSSNQYVCIKYVNTRNAFRFQQFDTYGPFELDSLRMEKAWKLYHKIREQYMRQWWD